MSDEDLTVDELDELLEKLRREIEDTRREIARRRFYYGMELPEKRNNKNETDENE